MLNVHIAQTIVQNITFLIAYIFSITLAGFFTAWMALKLGDDTAEQEGFLTLNPLAHIDFLGTAFLLLYKFGWGKFVPINPLNMQGRFRIVKVIFAFLAKPIAYLAIGFLALIPYAILCRIFGQGFMFDATVSSYVIAMGIILASFINVNVLLAIIDFLVNMCGIAVMYIAEKHQEYLDYAPFIMLVVPIVFFYFFGNHLYNFVIGFAEHINIFLITIFQLF